jgi:hypothetical protein
MHLRLQEQLSGVSSYPQIGNLGHGPKGKEVLSKELNDFLEEVGPNLPRKTWKGRVSMFLQDRWHCFRKDMEAQ